MDGKMMVGSVGKFPVGGGFLNVGPGDISQGVMLFSGLTKSVLKLGAVGAGLGLGMLGVLGLLLSGSSSKKPVKRPLSDEEKWKQYVSFLRKISSIDVLSIAKTGDQCFHGVCASESLDLYCEGQEMSIPTSVIKMISRENGKNVVSLFDGSYYVINLEKRIPDLEFWSVAGKNKLIIGRNFRFIRGIEIKQSKGILEEMRSFLDQNGHRVEELLKQEGIQRIVESCNLAIEQEKKILSQKDPKSHNSPNRVIAQAEKEANDMFRQNEIKTQKRIEALKEAEDMERQILEKKRKDPKSLTSQEQRLLQACARTRITLATRSPAFLIGNSLRAM